MIKLGEASTKARLISINIEPSRPAQMVPSPSPYKSHSSTTELTADSSHSTEPSSPAIFPADFDEDMRVWMAFATDIDSFITDSDADEEHVVVSQAEIWTRDDKDQRRLLSRGKDEAACRASVDGSSVRSSVSGVCGRCVTIDKRGSKVVEPGEIESPSGMFSWNKKASKRREQDELKVMATAYWALLESL